MLSTVCNQKSMVFMAYVFSGILSISLPLILGIDSSFGILSIAFLAPFSSLALIRQAQHYFKSVSSPQVRTVAYTFWLVVVCLITLLEVVEIPRAYTSEKLLFSIVWLWWLVLIIISLVALLRRSLIAVHDTSQSMSANYYNPKKASIDKEDEEDGNSESSSLLGSSSIVKTPQPRFEWHIFLIPFFVVLISLVVAPFWVVDNNDGNNGFGAFSYVVSTSSDSDMIWSSFSFRYEVWFPFIAILIIIFNNKRKWSHHFVQGVVLIMLTGLAFLLLYMHGSSDARKWYCNMGCTACASGWDVWLISETRWFEIVARLTGHLMNATLFVIMVPISNLQGFHYWLSHVFFVLALAHVLMIARTYDYYGFFPSDLWRLKPRYAPTNPTILAISIACLVYLGARVIAKFLGSTTKKFRNRVLGNKVLAYFQLLNFFTWAKKGSELSLLLVCCWHAPSGWCAALVGLLFHAYDLVVRTHRSARLTQVLTTGNAPGTGADVRGVLGGLFLLQYKVERYRGGRGKLPPILQKLNNKLCCSCFASQPKGSRSSAETGARSSTLNSYDKAKVWEPWEAITARPGQYVFLNCPEVSLFEWCPAFISSTPYDPCTTHHLPLHLGGWVDKLASVSALSSQSGHPITINVDGPYGVDEDLRKYDRLMIIGGGGGIGPCHAIFRQLHQEALSNQFPLRSEDSKVHLIWIAKHESCFEDEFMRSTLDMVKTNSCGGRFSFSLYTTQYQLSPVFNKSPDLNQALPITKGRPNWSSIFSAMSEWEQGQGRNGSGGAYVYTCGPDSLLHDCKHYAEQTGIPVSVNSTPTRPGGFSPETSR